VLLYLASTLYHALPHGRAGRVFRIIDHSAIFLLIAGTYTPFTLGVLRGSWGGTMLALVWGLAALGAFVRSIAARPWPRTTRAKHGGRDSPGWSGSGQSRGSAGRPWWTEL
jgi:hemolysin III